MEMICLSTVSSYTDVIIDLPVTFVANCLPYNLYCVGGDVKPCSNQSNPVVNLIDLWDALLQK